MFRSEIEKEEINKLEVRQFEGEIKIVEDRTAFSNAIQEIRKYDILGFDTETKPAYKKGVNNRVALIQVAGADVAWLFRVNKIGIPDALRSFLENDSLLKIGAGLADDMQRLRQLVQFTPGGFIDLQKYVDAFNIESKSLKKMVAIILGYKISKSQQLSNWESDFLTDQQVRYAATDAWVCLEMYHALRSFIKNYQ
ncbi:MAG: 3'-5' exonuclease [Bacteroidales bacterium]